MKSDKLKLVIGSIFKLTGLALLLGIVILLILGHYDKTFDFDIVDGSGPHAGSSQTKEEAIKRNTFVCDVKLPAQPYKVSNSHVLYLKSGWIEKSWTGGFWYWTTYIDTNDFYYNIVLQCSKEKNDTIDWTIINKETSPHSGYEQLQDNMSYLGTITGELNSLPVNDTLRYTVLKHDTIDFHTSNIEGTLLILLKNYAIAKSF
jgi:hypothetical protein